MFASQRITDRMLEAAANFLNSTHNSAAANAVLECLTTPHGLNHYGSFTDRNSLVRQLSSDVETRLGGISTKLMFETPGHLHDQLQTFLDIYLDAVDCIYYTQPTTAAATKTEA